MIAKENRLIVSIYDFTGQWVKPYIEAGYPVILWDYKVEGCILQNFDRLMCSIDDAIEAGYIPYGLFSAPPCTDVCVSGAQYWPAKDKAPAPLPYGPDWSITDLSTALIEITLHLQQIYGFKFWVMENPVGRLEKVCPEFQQYRQMIFQPHHYGDPYTKKTILWGEFNTALPRNDVEPIRVCAQGSWLQKLGGKSERTKELRSATPLGFSNAFYSANN